MLELLLVSPKKHSDQCGFFAEAFRADSFAAHGSRRALPMVTSGMRKIAKPSIRSRTITRRSATVALRGMMR
jgi:dTDP-4-dehydrorhamnose 3,5-epimerase-like enzyme